MCEIIIKALKVYDYNLSNYWYFTKVKQMERVLITGITGFLGASLLRYFHGNNRISIFGHSRDNKQAKAKFTRYKIDFITDLSAETIDAYHINSIIHLAGIAHDLSGNYTQRDYQRINYEKTIELYEEFVKSSADSFVFVSSIKAVVDHTNLIINEEFISNPTSEYGISKRKAEEYIINHVLNDKKYFILRPCMIHGLGNKGNLNLLYEFVKTGIPYPLGAFENKRSFLSVDNFCFVIQKIVENTLKPGSYLLSDNDPISTNDLVRLIGHGINKKVRIFNLPKFIIRIMAQIGSWIHAPFNTKTLTKLCENMVVSNQKLLLNLNENLPLSSIEGLKKTIKSFNE